MSLTCVGMKQALTTGNDRFRCSNHQSTRIVDDRKMIQTDIQPIMSTDRREKRDLITIYENTSRRSFLARDVH